MKFILFLISQLSTLILSNLNMSDRSKTKTSNSNHEHIAFTPDTDISQRWREYIECRACKRSIIEAIGLSFLQ